MPFIVYNFKKIEYVLSRRSKRNINIVIKNDEQIYVSAPKRVSLKEIESVLLDKIDWILKTKETMKTKNLISNHLSFENDSDILVYGELKKLKVIPNNRNYILIVDNEVLFYVKEKYINNIDYKNKCLTKLLREELMNTATEFINKYLKLMSLNISEFDIRIMKSRWGTCIPSKKKIVLNYNLIHCPLRSIEYVALHEVTHLIHPNHSKKFYDSISLYMNDWKDRKKALQNFVI